MSFRKKGRSYRLLCTGNELKIAVKYLGAFADATQSKEETLELAASSLGSLVEHLLEQNGERFRSLMIDPSTGEIRGGAALLVNGQRRGPQHKLVDGDEVALLTPIAGG